MNLYDRKIERVVLGACFVDTNASMQMLSRIKHEQVFTEVLHRKIYSRIRELTSENIGVDIVTVCQTMPEAMQAAIDMSSAVASTAHLDQHCAILLQFFIKRQITTYADTLHRQVKDPERDVFDILGYGMKGLHDMDDMLNGGRSEKNISSVLDNLRDRVEYLTNLDDAHGITGIPSGLGNIDKFTSGWQNSDLIIIGARPGMGKTSLALGNLLACAKAGQPAGIISLEMSAIQLVARLVCGDSSFHLKQLLNTGFEKDQYFTTFSQVSGRMKKYPIFFNDSSTIDIMELMMQARRWKSQHNLKFLIVDYLQLISDRTKKNNREQEVASITRKLKSLAKELDIPVIALAQLGRDVEKRGGSKRPKLSDLRESGSIEQDADIVSFLYRPEYYGLEVEEDILNKNCNSELIIEKFRNGGLGEIPLFWQGSKVRFYDRDPQAQQVSATAVPIDDDDNDMPF